MKDPVARTSSPYVDPAVKGPKSQILAEGPQSDLRKSKFSAVCFYTYDNPITYPLLPSSSSSHVTFGLSQKTISSATPLPSLPFASRYPIINHHHHLYHTITITIQSISSPRLSLPHSTQPHKVFQSTNMQAVFISNVNKTPLHPGGVAYVPQLFASASVPCWKSSISNLFSGYSPHQEHTELEEELHETAHIDYNRVAIVCFLPYRTAWDKSPYSNFVSLTTVTK